MKTLAIAASIIALSSTIAFAKRTKQPDVEITTMAVLTGTCSVQLFKEAEPFPCDSWVVYMLLSNGRSWFTFQKEDSSWTVSGGHDRQPQLQNYYLSIDTLRMNAGSKKEATDPNMEGECRLSTLPDNTDVFHEIHCDVYDRRTGIMANLHLDNITDVKK